MGLSVWLRRWIVVLTAGVLVGAGLVPAAGAAVSSATRGSVEVPVGISPTSLRVEAFEMIPDCCGGWGGSQSRGSVSVDASGAYAFTGLERGTYVFTVTDTARRLYVKSWSESGGPDDSSPYVVVAATGEGAVPTARLALGATLEGTVSGPVGGRSVAGVSVYLNEPFCHPRFGCAYRSVASATVADDGTYRFTGVRGDTLLVDGMGYRLSFVDPEGWFVPRPFGDGHGTTIKPHDGEVLDVGGQALEAAGKISGRVLVPVELTDSVFITPYRFAEVDGQTEWVRGDGDYASHETREFTLSGLAPGRYRLQVGPSLSSSGSEKWYPNSPTLEGAVDVIVEADRVTSGIVADLRPDGYQPPVPELEPIWSTTHPRVKGKTAVGRTLRVTRGEWSPSTVTLSHQWFVRKAGRTVRLRAATRPSLRLTKALLGKRVRVRVTATKSGHRTATFRSKWSSRVTKRGSRP